MSRYETAVRIEEARRGGVITDADADRLHRANEELHRHADRCDAAGYTLHAPGRVGIDVAREGGDAIGISVVAQDGLGNRTFRPIIPASRGILPTREELERELREVGAAFRLPGDFLDPLRLPTDPEPTRSVLEAEARARFRALRDDLARHGRVTELRTPPETELRTVRALVHIRCPNVGVDEVSLVVPSRNEAVRICASCSFAWSESFLEQARDLEAIDLARARVPEIRFVEAIGNLERRESGRFSYGSPAEIPAEAEALAPASSRLPEYRPR